MEFLSATAELNYMTQIVIMLFEDPSKVSTQFVVFLHNLEFLICFSTSVIDLRLSNLCKT